MLTLERKLELIRSTIYLDFKKYQLAISNLKKPCFFNNVSTNYLNIEDFYDEKDINDCAKLYESHRKRVQRLKKSIIKLLEKPCLFLTITYNEDFYQKYNSDERKLFIKKFLNSLNCSYRANVDFGKINEREHYHAIVQIPKINFNSWKYGNLDFRKININNSSALSKYLVKLTNHAVKDTCREERYLFRNYKSNKNKLAVYTEMMPLIGKEKNIIDNIFAS